MATPERPLLAARDVVRRYPGRGLRWAKARATVAALDGATLELRRGEILGLLGRSGSGKSTLARVMLGLEPADGGEVEYGGRPIELMTRRELRRLRREIQVVFQDPRGALDPRHSVGSIVAEPLVIHGVRGPRSRRERVAALLREVGLPGEGTFLRRSPRELSGGERQRVALARALACEPKAIVLDEPVSALDASVQGQVMNLLLDLHDRSGLAMLLITHDVRLVARICTRVAVIARGRVVEEGTTRSVLARPEDATTVELLAAASALSTVGSA